MRSEGFALGAILSAVILVLPAASSAGANRHVVVSIGIASTASVGPTANFIARQDRMTTTVDASASSGGPDVNIVSYSWEWGDGSSVSGGMEVVSNHTYTAPGRYTVVLTVMDSAGHSASTSRLVSPANTTVDILEDRFFTAECPYHVYWNTRSGSSGDLILSNHPPCADYYPWVLFSSNQALQATNPSWIYSTYRFDARVRNHPGYSLTQPVFLPVFDPTVAPAAGSYVKVDLHTNYMNDSYVRDVNRSHPDYPISLAFTDGYGYLVQGTFTMDLTTSRRIFGVQATTPAQAWAWWRNSTIAGRQAGPVEQRLDAWLGYNGVVNPGVPGSGKYDIFNGYGWYVQTDITDLNATVAPDGTTTVRIFQDSWGVDALFMRWFYWGNASYVLAVNNPYGTVHPQGWMPMEQCWCEDSHIQATITTDLDLDFQAIQTYHFMAWANWGPDGVPGTADDQPAWVWSPVLEDYVPREGSGSPASEGYPNSELRWYEGRSSVHGTPGSYAYGQPYEYMNAPTRWILNPGSTLTMVMPQTNVTWYDPVLSAWNQSTKRGDYTTFSSPMVLGQICTSDNPSSCSSANQGDFYRWDPQAKVLSFAGPYDWGSSSLPLKAAPWVEFKPLIYTPSNLTVGRPTYAKGDVWNYTVSSAMPIGGSAGDIAFQFEGTRTLRITQVRPVVLESDVTSAAGSATMVYYDGSIGVYQTVYVAATLNAYLTRSLGGWEAGDTNYTGTIYLNGTATLNGVSVPFALKETLTSTLGVDLWNFPLRSGLRGRTTSHASVRLESNSLYFPYPPTTVTTDTSTAYAAGRPENVTVPAGSFATLPVASTSTTTVWGGGAPPLGPMDIPRARSYFSPTAMGVVKLTAYDAVGDEVAQEALVSYHLVPPLVATAAVDHSSGTVPLAVHFNAGVTGGVGPYSYSWTFGDGGMAIGASPDHSFAAPGTFDAEVTVADASDQVAVADVTVTVGVAPMVANPSANVGAGGSSLGVDFSATASGGVPPYTYAWDFGDGSTAVGTNPHHIYVHPGTYTVTLTVTDGEGKTTTATTTVSLKQNTPLYASPLVLGPAAAAVLIIALLAVVMARRRRTRGPPPPPTDRTS